MIVRHHETLPADDVRRVRQLADRVSAEVGAPQLNDESLLRLEESRPGLVHLLCEDGGRLTGYAQLLAGTAEIVLSGPAAAGLLDAAEQQAGDGLTLWAHGRHSPVSPLAEERGYRRIRELWQLRRPLDGDLPDAPLPAGIRVRPFVISQDEQAWLRVNAAAFASHPEQGGWTLADLRAREREPWFDPAGFLIAERESDASLAGFHWTKIHPDGTGEVYVIAVDPSATGMRLGPALLVTGLSHLRARGCTEVLLYVDASNTVAVRLYERFGFTRHEVDIQWQLPGSALARQ